jgi:hypothetical protein
MKRFTTGCGFVGGALMMVAIPFATIGMGLVAPIRYPIKDIPPRVKAFVLATLCAATLLLTPY